MAELQGFHDYPMVTVSHPITSLSESEIMARADLATEWVHAMLVDGVASMVGDSEIVFHLHIPDQACAECIMPSNILLPIFRTQVASMLGAGFVVSLNDPREDKDHPLHRM
jgi:hypothetical protein